MEASGTVRIVTPHGVFFGPRGDALTHQLARHGAHTRNELAMVLAHLKAGDTFVDIGAHIGTFVIPAANTVGPTGRCLAVEGDRETYDLLCRNIAENQLDSRIATVHGIVGDGSEQGLRRVEVAGNTGAGHYVSDSAGTDSAVSAYSILHEHEMLHPDFIKIDVEGMEMGVLRSLRPILASAHPNLYIEISKHQLNRFGTKIPDVELYLRDLGYSFFRNIGERNSSNDEFKKTPLDTLLQGGDFFDLLALPLQARG